MAGKIKRFVPRRLSANDIDVNGNVTVTFTADATTSGVKAWTVEAFGQANNCSGQPFSIQTGFSQPNVDVADTTASITASVTTPTNLGTFTTATVPRYLQRQRGRQLWRCRAKRQQHNVHTPAPRLPVLDWVCMASCRREPFDDPWSHDVEQRRVLERQRDASSLGVLSSSAPIQCKPRLRTRRATLSQEQPSPSRSRPPPDETRLHQHSVQRRRRTVPWSHQHPNTEFQDSVATNVTTDTTVNLATNNGGRGRGGGVLQRQYLCDGNYERHDPEHNELRELLLQGNGARWGLTRAHSVCDGLDVGDASPRSTRLTRRSLSIPLATRRAGDPDFTVSATASSGLTVSFSSQTLTKCTVSGSTVHIVAAGLCTIQACGNADYNAAPNVRPELHYRQGGRGDRRHRLRGTYDGEAHTARGTATGATART